MTNPTHIPGDYDVIKSDAQASANKQPDTSMGRSFAAMIDELRCLAVPHIHINPQPEEFEDVADFIKRVAAIADRWLLSVGTEVRSSAIGTVDMRQFTDVFVSAIEGNATFELDRAAEDYRGEYESVDRAVRHGRTALAVIARIRDERGL
jgi:hypothetical protein